MKVKTVERIEAARAKIEPGAAIHARLPRGKTGEALLTPELIDTVETLLLEGNTRFNASRVVGLQRSTMARWIKKGSEDIAEGVESLEAQFAFMVDRCEGEQERRLVAKAFEAAMLPTADGAMALKLLERRNPDDWAPALPDSPDMAAQYSALKADAFKKEAIRLLKQATEGQETIVEAEVVAPDKK